MRFVLHLEMKRNFRLNNFPIFAVLFFLADDVLQILYGSAYAGAAPVLTILAANYFLHAALGFTGSNLVVAGNTRWQLVAHLSALVVKIGAAIVLIPPYGMTGAAFATLAGTCLTNGINLVVAGFKYGLHPFTLSWTRAAVLLVGGAFLVDRVTVWVGVGSFGRIGLFVLGLAGLALVLTWARVIFDEEDRQLLVRCLR